MSRRWIVALASVVIAAPAPAQFTTFIAPPSPVKDSIKAAVVAQQHAAADSITRAQITDMKTWVDSAAGLVAPVRPTDTTSARDTTLTKNNTTVARSTVPGAALAPETASPLPFMLVIGVAAMLLGLAMMRKPSLLYRRIDR